MRSFLVVLLIIVFALGVCLTKEFYDKLDRYLISCHITDFKCFKRQYVSLRDHVLLGSLKMNIPDFEPLYVQYGDTGTCIKLSGFEESQLVGIGIDSENKEYSMVLELPLKLQQVENISTCEVPEKAFHDIPLQEGPLKKFSGNASIQVVYPYELKKKKSQVYMLLGEEGLDVILDIPDLTDLKLLSKEDQREYELSEWAYDVVEHINAAQVFALPFTSRMRLFTDRIPMEKFLLLYPEEEYTDVNFQYCESPFFKIGHLSTVKSEYDQTI